MEPRNYRGIMSVDQETEKQVSCTKEELEDFVKKCTDFVKSREWTYQAESLRLLQVFFVYLDPDRVKEIVEDYQLRIDNGRKLDLFTFTGTTYTKKKCDFKFLLDDLKVNLEKFQESKNNDEVVKAYANIIGVILIALVAGTIYDSEALKLWYTALKGMEKRFTEEEKASKEIAKGLLGDLKNKCNEWHTKLESIYANWSEATKYSQIPCHYYFVLYIVSKVIKMGIISCTLI
ncbi:hypothetical protein Ciccas_009720 [Cichlidogyrus casuarinus]|uniref:Uncharacterized protein n=1 Tax=Cichlidogyrus casuarinus TaxID=1844966 RepID=A0ABD2PW78_9PLAT